MEIAKFVIETVGDLNEKYFDEMSKLIIGKYIYFSIIKKENINQEILSEKLADYVEKLELNTSKKFNQHLKNYIDNIGSLVKNRLISESRAEKYYTLARSKVDSNELEIDQLIDYTRIILCIYTNVIKNEYNDISEFDFSFENVDLSVILSSMKLEETSELDVGFVKWGSKKKFNTDNLYCSDTLTFMLVIILYYHLKNIEIKGD